MSLPFPSFPPHIQLAITQKLPIRDYLNFCQSSRCSFTVAENVKTKILLTEPGEEKLTIFRKYSNNEIKIQVESGFAFVFGSPIRFELDRATFKGHPNMLSFLTNFFMTTNSSIKKLSIQTFIGGADVFNDLLLFGKVKDLEITSFQTMPSFSHFPAMKQLDSLIACCYLDDSDLLQLLNVKVLNLFDTCVTGLGINTFIKEIVSKNRHLEYISVKTDKDFTISDILSSVPILSKNYNNVSDPEKGVFVVGAETKYCVDVMGQTVTIQRIPT